MNLPAELRYSREHEWVRSDGGRARVGITDYAQDALGDVVFVDLPDVGLEVIAAASCAEIESTKSVSEIYAPVSGRVAAVNEALVESPELVNSDPYGDGWILELDSVEPSEVESLLDADSYRSLIEE